MQDRLPQQSPFKERLNSALLEGLFHLGLKLSGSFARRENLHRICNDVMNAFFHLWPSFSDVVCQNMAQVLGLPATHPKVRAKAQSMIRNQAKAWVDFFHYGQKSTEELRAVINTFTGIQQLQSLLDQHKGAILLTAHTGNFELGGLLLRLLDTEIHVVYKADRYPAVEKIRTRIREQGGVQGIAVDGIGFSTLPLLKLLREGKLVGMQGDRDFSLNGLALPFLGRETYFPKGPWELAAMTGAPILCAFFYMDEAGRFHARFEKPIYITNQREFRQEAIRFGMQSYVAHLESVVRAHPEQWYCFYPFWDDPLRKRTGSPNS